MWAAHLPPIDMERGFMQFQCYLHSRIETAQSNVT